jgi:SpoIID/LytB domain protein
VIARFAFVVIALVVVAAVPVPAAAAPPAALPATIRVNLSVLGVTYARIGSTGSFTVTGADGAVVYRGSAYTVTRRGVLRLADASQAAAVPDSTSRDGRRNLASELREARLTAGLENVTIVTVPFEFSIEEPGTDPLAPPLFSSATIVPLHFEPNGGLLSYNGRVFRGTLDLTTDDEGDMIVVNEVDTTSYLASVVGSEEPTTWMPEALAAQAIAARTYLRTHLGRHDRYDLEGDPRDQQYDGLAGEEASTLRAVEGTAGLIATYRGAAIEALYSANAGGYTEDSENVYINALPYLRAVPSPTDEIAISSSWGHTSWQWTTEYTEPQLTRYLAARGIDVGELQQIDLVRLTGTGRVMTARVVGSSGSRDISKDAARYFFGLRSTLFTITARPPEIEYVNVGDTERIRQLELLGATVERTLRPPNDPDLEGRARRIIGWVYRLPGRFVFSGRGFGHGVGMSQWGAQGMALGGASAEEILTHYYRGIAITNIGGP